MVRRIYFLLFLSVCSLSGHAQKEVFDIFLDADIKEQTIHNFGASGCWYSENIGKNWPDKKKEHIAALLFSKDFDEGGNPLGIGLSAWRFNIGGGSFEQGDSSGIGNPQRRVESFLNPDGTYDWKKQEGYIWFTRRAKDYGVENLIAFVNSPPVQYTENNRAFKTIKDFKSNLKPEKYQEYVDFLTTVVQHFDSENLHFDYISPVNEPQWDWTGIPGKAKQEGSPWTNKEMYKVITELNSSLEKKQLSTQIMLPEAAMLTYLYEGDSPASRQIQQFHESESELYLGNLSHVPDFVAGHSYFTDNGDSAMAAIRKTVADTAHKYGVEYWQTEYSMLGDGFREGEKGKRTEMDCALFLSKVIHRDLVDGNAAAWHFWNALEPGNAEFDTRYYVIALHPDSNVQYSITKNLWALGHYSRFIRPGMQRLQLNQDFSEKNILVSAYTGKQKNLVIVATNNSNQEQTLKLNLRNFAEFKSAIQYLTTASDKENMKPLLLETFGTEVKLPARSISTFVLEP